MGKAKLSSKLVVSSAGAVVGRATILNFIGATVADAGSGQINVTIAGGGGSSWNLNGNTVVSEKFIGTIDNFDFPIYTNNTRRVTVTNAGDVGIGIQVPLATVQIVTPSSASLTKDSLILSHENTGTTPAVQTGLRYKVWINNFAADASRIYSYSTSINSGDQHIVIQTLNNSTGLFDVTDFGFLSIKNNVQYYSKKITLTDAATIALDWAGGNVQYVVLGGNRTFTFTNPMDGGRYIIILKQDGTGSRTVTWPAAVLWQNAAAPTLSTGANKVDVITFVYDGTNSKYYAGANLNY
jgi:hypothetical protein